MINQNQMPLLENNELPVEDTVEVAFLKENQWSDFYRSVLTQYETKGFISDRQKACIQKAMVKKIQFQEAPKIKPDTKVPEYTLKKGEIIEIKPWIAKKLKEQLNLEFFLRNLEITEVEDETAKAYCISFKFVSKPLSSCHVCGKALDNEVSIITGIGPSCAKKLGLPRPTVLEANLTLVAFEALCSKTGIIGPLWLPKNQIKGRTV